MIGKTAFLFLLFVLLTDVEGKPLRKVHRSHKMEDNPRDCHGDKNCQGHEFSDVEKRRSVKQKGLTQMSTLLAKIFDFDFADDDDSYLKSKSRYAKEDEKMDVKAEVKMSLYRNYYNYKYNDEEDFTDDGDIYEDDGSVDYYDGDYDEEVIDDHDDDDEKDDDEGFDEVNGNKGDDDEDTRSLSSIEKFLFDDNDNANADKPLVFKPQGYSSLCDDILDSN